MSDPIAATTPTALSVTFDRWAVQSMTFSGDGCVAFGDPPAAAAPLSVSVTFVKARVRPDGAWERSPLPADAVSVAMGAVAAEIATGSPLGVKLAAALDAARAAAVLAATGKL